MEIQEYEKISTQNCKNPVLRGELHSNPSHPTQKGDCRINGLSDVHASIFFDSTWSFNYRDDDGSYHKTDGTIHADGAFTFATNHFFAYAIMTEEKSIYYTDYLLKTIRIAR